MTVYKKIHIVQYGMMVHCYIIIIFIAFNPSKQSGGALQSERVNALVPMGGMMTAGLCANDEIPLLDQPDQDYGIELRDETNQAAKVGVSAVRTTTSGARQPWYIYILAFISAIGGFLFGYDTGVVAGASLPIGTKFKFNTLEKELFVSITVAAAAIFAIVGGVLNDKIGRKPTTLIASTVFTIGAIVLAAANNKPTLVIGRFILGIGIGIASMTVPVYIAESAPPHLRGPLVSLNQAFISGGMFVSLLVSGGFCPVDGGWRWMLGLAAAPAIIQFIGFLFMPESPRWLVDQGKNEIAITVLRRLRGVVDVSEEFKSIKQACDEEKEAKARAAGSQFVFVKVLTNPPVRRALIIGCSLQMFQQITGINTIMYYSATIIRMSGISDPCKAIWFASITALVNFLFTFVGIAVVERIGRRPLFIASLIGVTLSLGVLGVAFHVESVNTPNVTIISNIANDPCAYKTCGACIEDIDCGFCYKRGDIYNNASCLAATLTEEPADTATCSGPFDTTHIWAYNFCPTAYSWMAIVGMVLYLACFSPGMGPMPWTINSEIYPLWARSFSNSVATFTNWTFNLIISMTFLSLSESITRHGAFYLYASFGVVGIIYFYFFLPETRGRSLEEMESLFSGSWFVRRQQLKTPTASDQGSNPCSDQEAN